MVRRLPLGLLLALFLLASASLCTAQDKKDPPKKDDKKAEMKKDDKKGELKNDKKDEMKKDDKKPLVEPEEQSFKTADGVKLIGKLYKSPKGAQPVVLLLHDYKANPNEAIWEDIAQTLVGKGYNVFRFDFRGHGKSTDITPSDFFSRAENKAYVSTGGVNAAVKNTIKFTDFKANYFPMLVQDIAAARNALDQLNDTGVVNTSTVYLMGTGDMATLGFLYIASEYSRERQKPNLATPPNYVSIRRNLFPQSEAAGPDIGGAIWLSPNRPTSIPLQQIKEWCLYPATVNMRTETAMLFITGEKDTKSSPVAKSLFKDVLRVDAKTGPSGEKLLKPELTYLREIKGSAAIGTKLLGNNLGTETMIEDFLTAVDKDRRSRTRKNREWDKPLWINVQDYGVCRPQ
jgi:hypothetical protein